MTGSIGSIRLRNEGGSVDLVLLGLMGMFVVLSFVLGMHRLRQAFEKESNLFGSPEPRGIVAEFEELVTDEAPPQTTLLGSPISKIPPPLDYGAKGQGNQPYAGAECLLRYFVEEKQWKGSCLNALW